MPSKRELGWSRVLVPGKDERVSTSRGRTDGNASLLLTRTYLHVVYTPLVALLPLPFHLILALEQFLFEPVTTIYCMNKYRIQVLRKNMRTNTVPSVPWLYSESIWRRWRTSILWFLGPF